MSLMKKFLNNLKILKEDKIKYPFFIALITLFGAFLRLKKLTFQSLWFDELFSLDIALDKSPLDITEISKSHGFNPPFYYILLWLWGKISGVNEYSLRFFSALMGILGILALYFLARELFSKKAGVYASLLASINFFHIYYSQEARSYSFIFLLTILSYLFLIKLLKNPNFKNAILYIVSTVALLYSHYFGYFVLASEIVFLVFALFSKGKEKIKRLKYLAISIGSITVFVLPWLPALSRIEKISSFWTEKPTPHFFITYFKTFLGHEPFLIMIFSLLLIIYFIHQSDKSVNFEYHKTLLFLWVFITLFIPYFRSFGHPSPLHPRYAIVILPALILMAAKAIESIREKPLRFLLLSTLFLMSLISLFYSNNYYKATTKQQWREAARYAVQNDPNKKYLLCGHFFFKLYLNNIFHHDASLNDTPKDTNCATELIEKIRKERIPGIWILEVDGFDFMPESVRELFNKNLRKSLFVHFLSVKVTLYISPDKLKDLIQKSTMLLRGNKIGGEVIKIGDGIYEISSLTKLVTPLISFSPGNYLLQFKARAFTENKNARCLRIYSEEKIKAQIVCPESELREYEAILSFKKPVKSRIYLEVDTSRIPSAELKNDTTIRIGLIVLKKMK